MAPQTEDMMSTDDKPAVPLMVTVKEYAPLATLGFVIITFFVALKDVPDRVTTLEREKVESDKQQILLDTQQSAAITEQGRQIHQAIEGLKETNKELNDLNRYLRGERK